MYYWTRAQRREGSWQEWTAWTLKDPRGGSSIAVVDAVVSDKEIEAQSPEKPCNGSGEVTFEVSI
jgi:hypothetical protein